MTKNTFIFNVLNPVRRPRLSRKVWISRKELSKYFKKVVWIARLDEYSASLLLLCTRIKVMTERSGFSPTFYYLKEVYRLVIRYIAGHGEPRSVLSNTVLVKRDHHGLPTIIPLNLRKVLMN
jgi:hypothetical protein